MNEVVRFKTKEQIEFDKQIDQTINYLKTGGLGETIGFIETYRAMKFKSVQIDVDHALALCIMAGESENTINRNDLAEKLSKAADINEIKAILAEHNL